MILVTKETDV